MARTKTKNADGSAANLGFEAKLWLTADKLRNNMGISLKKLSMIALQPGLPVYISDGIGGL